MFEYLFCAEGMESKTDVGSGSLKWSAFSRAQETRDGVLLYTHPQIFHWMPKTAFQSDSEYQRFIDLVKSSVQAFKTFHS